MLFNSPFFLYFFLPVCVCLHYLVGRKWKNSLLILFSLFFYFVEEGLFTMVLIGSIVVSYSSGYMLCYTKNMPKQLILGLGLAINLGILFLFKYYNFFYLNIFGEPSEPGIALLLGISFFTFQGVSYLVDSYRGQIEASKNIVDFTCYICMFPQLVAGPIIRYSEISQALNERIISQNDLIRGLHRFSIGFAKKVIIADHLAILADFIFETNGNLPASVAWLGLIIFTLQIYFDFSGYSDMAIGIGRMLGFKFPENFSFPFLTTSIRSFWRKWHMTLTNWFKDYVFIPLGGSRVIIVRNLINILIVFSLTGFWHGAQWTFLVWGLLHGLVLCIEKLVKKPAIAALRPVYILYNFLLVALLFGVFRAQDLTQVGEFISFLGNFSPNADFEFFFLMDSFKICILILSIIIAFGLWHPVEHLFSKRINLDGQWFLLITSIFLLGFSMLELSTSSYSPFLYFKF